jgi:hypothetical protein
MASPNTMCETTTCFVSKQRPTMSKKDYDINKGVENLAPLREKLQGITTRYQEVQQDILETFLDRGELRSLGQSTVHANGKRVPGLKLDHPRQLAVMSS